MDMPSRSPLPGALFTAASLAGLACARAPARETAARDAAATPSAETTSPAAATPPAPALAPLPGPWLSPLVVDEGEAFVAVPVGAREPRPVIVGVHGAGDRADWACSEWWATTAGYAFVVCPKGVPSPWKGFSSWGSAEQIARRADGAVRALRARYGAHVASGPLVYGGWSQGGTLAAQVIASHPGVYTRALLLEVGHTPLDPRATVASLQRGGVERAILECTSMPCRAFGRDLDRAAKRAALPLQIVDVGLRGHVFDEPVFRALGPAFVALVEDDPRWAGLEAQVRAKWPESAAR